MRFAPFTDAALADPYPQYAALRAADPVHWSEKLRAWVLFRDHDVAAALRDEARFSADRRRASRAAGGALEPALRTVSSDPPDGHAAHALLNAALVPRVRAIGPRIDAIVDELLAGIDGRREIDLIDEFAHALPIRVIAELLDIPEAERTRFQGLSRTIARGMDRLYGSDDVSSGLREIGAYFLGLVTERAETGGDDLVHRLLAAEHQGDRLAPLEVVAMCTALVFGGQRDHRQPIANGMLALLRNPGRARASAGRSVARAVCGRGARPLRHAAAVRVPRRRDAVRARRQGARAGRLHAPRDRPCEPRSGRIRRAGPAGPLAHAQPARRLRPRHALLPGAQLARMETRAALGALLSRFPHLALAGPPVWRRTVILRGLEHLPLCLVQ